MGKVQTPINPTDSSRFYLFVVTVSREQAGHNFFIFAVMRGE
jgi:hypothetical protein